MWERHESFRDRSVRDELILRYLPLVRKTAAHMAAELTSSVEVADLASYGAFGLINAIEKFDPRRGFRFETYAACRIRGAILDGVRSLDWVPRSVRAKVRDADHAQSRLEHMLRRAPTQAELASEMGISVANMHGLARQKSVASVLQLDRSDVDGQRTLGELLADNADGPDVELEVAEMRGILAGAVERLGDRERTVVRLYYFEGLNVTAIAERLSVTQSRICQIRASAILRLRTRLGPTLREAA
jgi:RNA polymerase sigma factor FliA